MGVVIDLFKKPPEERAEIVVDEETFDAVQVHLMAAFYDIENATTIRGLREIVERMSADMEGWSEG